MLQIAQISAEHSLYSTAVEAGGDAPPALWARRSLFAARGDSLLVNEVFLPAIELCAPPRHVLRRYRR